MKRATPSLVLLLVLVPACGRPAPPAGPLDARVAALMEEVGRALGEPFGDPPVVEVLTQAEIQDILAAAPEDWSPLPGDADILLRALGRFAQAQSAHPVPGSNRLLVTRDLLRAAPEEIDGKLARGLAGLWFGRRLGGPEFLAELGGTARSVRQLAASALADEVDRCLRAEREDSPSEPPDRLPLTEEQREMVGPFLSRSFQVALEQVTTVAAFRDAVVSAWGLGGALDEIRRRPPETFREILRPEEYVRGERLPDPATATAARLEGVLEGGMECIGATRVTLPVGVGGVTILHLGTGRNSALSETRLLLARDGESAAGLFAQLLEQERAAESEWSWLSSQEMDVPLPEGRGVVFHRRAFTVREPAVGDTALFTRGDLVLRIEFRDAAEAYTDAAGLGRRILARAVGDAPPAAEAWEERWWEFARAGRIEEALADPDPRIRRRAAARRHVLDEPDRVSFAALARACADPDPEVRCAAFEALSFRCIDGGDDPPEEVAATIARGLLEPDAGVRVRAAQCLDYFPWDSQVLVAAVARALRDDDGRVRSTTATGVSLGLEDHGWELPPDWIGALLDLLGDEDSSARLAAATALGYAPAPGPEIRTALEAHVEDPDAGVWDAAKDSLIRLEGR